MARATGTEALAAVGGATLLGERAMLSGFRVTERVSAGGGCRLYDAADGTIALNLARPDDRALLPALFESEVADDATIAALVGRSGARALVDRGRSMGLAIAAGEEEAAPYPAWTMLAAALPVVDDRRRPPRVLDLSALWAGPLAAHLLWLAGAEVSKIESTARPDAMRNGDTDFFALLNQGKASIVLDLASRDDRRALLALIAGADIVVEAARPRALRQLGIDADALVRATPGLVWLTITGHGAEGEAANWIGLGDDCGVAAGLSAALYRASGIMGFVGDAIADPLTGIRAAAIAWDAWMKGTGGRFGLSMRGVAAAALAQARHDDPAALAGALAAWGAAVGAPFPTVGRRAAASARPLGADNGTRLAALAPC
ncbi:CoA transferase [uncultured Sphingomonas sp.]|uniref:CoA transferase n=1 Tax=uncultured Sphingomonas sp. TaxID=158754 RepID=UPI0035CB0344